MKRKTELVATESVEYGMMGRVNIPGHFMHDRTGVVAEWDAYTVTLRFSEITPEMEGYEDARTGLVTFEPKDLTWL